MTVQPVDAEAEAISDHLRHLIRTKYRTQTAAGRAWGVSQSAISLLINGKRGTGRSEALQKIAAAEGLSLKELLTATHRPHLAEVRIREAASPRFVYDVDDPHRMLKQVQSWFADLPAGPRMSRQVVKAVMRTLLDESFDFEIHRPSAEWQPVMEYTEGWPLRAKGGRRSGRSAPS